MERKNLKVLVEAKDQHVPTAIIPDAATAECHTTSSPSGSAATMQPATATISIARETTSRSEYEWEAGQQISPSTGGVGFADTNAVGTVTTIGFQSDLASSFSGVPSSKACSNGELLASWEEAMMHQRAQQRQQRDKGKNKEEAEEETIEAIKQKSGGFFTLADPGITPELDIMGESEAMIPAVIPGGMQLDEHNIDASPMSVDNNTPRKRRRQERSNDSSNAGRKSKATRGT
ncbi:hypothetical protein DL98DRAFT_534475 [Cadophora sp. DSE1049]|nr:hypothetical protein DL98DRAFT_534475 [Cadophora sp. DSE1049]